MAELNQKYRYTAFLALAIIIFSIFLIRDYDNSKNTLTTEQKNIYIIMFIYLIINMLLCIVFLYYYSILDNMIESNKMNEVQPILNKLEIFYNIINISSLPFVLIVIFKLVNKYKDSFENIPPEFNLNTQRYY
jgi:Na+/H+ antiporter NhaC